MIFSHKDYLTYELPNDWCSEDEEENLLIYNPNGEGAITVSFFNILELRETLDEHISIMAKKFIDQNGIIMRTRSRFRDFVNRGLLEGSINSPAITFSGLRQLERLVTDSESINNFTHEFLNVVRENRSMITRHEKQIDKLLEKLEVQIATSEKNNRDVVAMAADVVSILSIVPSIMDKIPAIENVIHNLFSFFNF